MTGLFEGRNDDELCPVKATKVWISPENKRHFKRFKNIVTVCKLFQLLSLHHTDAKMYFPVIVFLTEYYSSNEINPYHNNFEFLYNLLSKKKRYVVD